MAVMRAQEKKKHMLLMREKMHQDLMKLSKTEPPISLKWAAILSSNKIWKDCDIVKERVNHCFQLNIKMSWCT